MVRTVAIVFVLAAAAVVALWQFGVVSLPGAVRRPRSDRDGPPAHRPPRRPG